MKLHIERLNVEFHTPYATVSAVRDVTLTVAAGETVAVVGESGCGKSVTALSVMGLLPKRRCTVQGSIRFHGQELVGLSERRYRALRGQKIGMIFQDPMTALNPTMRLGKQVIEAMGKEGSRELAISLLHEVGIPDPETRVDAYPHQFSGGQRQRATIAMALAGKPDLIIADEPTTALDVTMQGQILDLLEGYQQKTGAGILLITHDLGVVAGIADRVVVMYAGRVAEQGPVESIFANPSPPDTRALLDSIPHLEQPRKRLPSIPGSPPSLALPLPGCPFWKRCGKAMRVCQTHGPLLTQVAHDHHSACWLHHKEAK